MKDNESFDTSSDLESEKEQDELSCFRELTEDSELMIILENTAKCEECQYRNADMAELTVHVVKDHNSCDCCDTRLWLEQSSWVRCYDKIHNIEREDALLRLQYRAEIQPKYRKWKGPNPCLYK